MIHTDPLWFLETRWYRMEWYMCVIDCFWASSVTSVCCSWNWLRYEHWTLCKHSLPWVILQWSLEPWNLSTMHTSVWPGALFVGYHNHVIRLRECHAPHTGIFVCLHFIHVGMCGSTVFWGKKCVDLRSLYVSLMCILILGNLLHLLQGFIRLNLLYVVCPVCSVCHSVGKKFAALQLGIPIYSGV